MKTLFGTFKILIGISAIIAMYLASSFWIGSKGEWENQVKSHLGEFFFSRLLFTMIAGSIFFLLSLLLNRLLKKSIAYKKKYILFELLAIIVISALLVLKRIYWNS